MKKEIIICLSVIVIVVMVNVVSERHTNSIMEQIKEELIILREGLLAGDDVKINEEIEKTFENWKKEKDILAVYIEHNELEKIEMYLYEIKSNAETKEYNMAIEALDICNYIMEHIKDKYKFALKNIF